MMFLVRQMQLITALQSWKVVFVTDRTQLEEQLGDTGGGIGFSLKKAEFINPRADKPMCSLKELLSTNTSDLVMAMIHKFQELPGTRTQGPRTARLVERRDERLEHHLRGSAHRHLQPGQDRERPAEAGTPVSN